MVSDLAHNGVKYLKSTENEVTLQYTTIHLNKIDKNDKNEYNDN